METKKMIKEQEAAKKAAVEKEIKNGAIAPAVEQKKQPIKKEVVKKKIIHYKDFANYAICGVEVSTENLTRDSEKVTCKNCMRTKHWKEYLAKKIK